MVMVFVLDNYDSFTYNLVQYMGELGAEIVVRRNDELTPGEVEAMRPDRILISPGPCTPEEAGISIELIRHFARLGASGGRRVPLLGVCLGHQAIGAAFGGDVVRAAQLMHGKTSEVEHDGRTIFAGIPSAMTCTRYHSLIVAEKGLPKELEISARVVGTRGEGGSVEHVKEPGLKPNKAVGVLPRAEARGSLRVKPSRSGDLRPEVEGRGSLRVKPSRSGDLRREIEAGGSLQKPGASTDGGERTIMALRHRELPIEGVQFHPESVLTTHGKKIVENFLKM